jgi:DNA-binding NarL/FixJ family response regulator
MTLYREPTEEQASGRVSGRIRVLIADDHQMFRQGLREMIATDADVEVVGEAGDGEEAVTLAKRVRPDVVLLDVEMPRMGAAEAMPWLLKEVSPTPRVVVVTMHDDPRLVRDLLARGASAYLTKSASLEELLSAVRAAYESGERGAVMVVPREILDDNGNDAGGLSDRELEVLLQAARGLSNRQIASSLHLSEATVKRHLANIYPKLGVGSRTEAVRMALSNGWISMRELSEGR